MTKTDQNLLNMTHKHKWPTNDSDTTRWFQCVAATLWNDPIRAKFVSRRLLGYPEYRCQGTFSYWSQPARSNGANDRCQDNDNANAIRNNSFQQIWIVRVCYTRTMNAYQGQHDNMRLRLIPPPNPTNTLTNNCYVGKRYGLSTWIAMTAQHTHTNWKNHLLN